MYGTKVTIDELLRRTDEMGNSIDIVIVSEDDDGVAILGREETKVSIPIGEPTRVKYIVAGSCDEENYEAEMEVEVIRLYVANAEDASNWKERYQVFIRETDENCWYRIYPDDNGVYRWKL